MSVLGSSFLQSMIANHHPFLFVAAMSASKIIGSVVLLLFLLFVGYLILRSMGIDHHTPPSMIFRKIRLFFRSFFAPFLYKKRFAQAEALDKKGQVAEALDIYLSLFDFDGLLASNANIAIQNDTILERIEDICDRTGYEFPAEQINRFKEDIYDYFLVRQKYLSPADYDGTPLHRPENEKRFKQNLNLQQEQALIEKFEQFLTTLVTKLKKHSQKDGIVIRPKSDQPKMGSPDVFAVEEEMPASNAPMASFASQEALQSPLSASSQQVEEEEVADPFAGLGPASASASVEDSSDPFASQNPFAVEDPKDPFKEVTGTINKLPGPADDPSPIAASSDPFAGISSSNTNQPPATPAPASPSSSSFPSSTPTSSEPPQSFPPNPFTTPQPTGGFPGFGNSSPAPTPSSPSLPSPAPTPAPTSMPQPTGGFPGFGQTQPSAPNPLLNQNPLQPQQPTGGFPGFNQPPTPAPGFPPPANNPFAPPQQQNPSVGPAFSTPSGTFGSVPAPPTPQPTGGFPGFTSQPPAPNPTPAPTSMPQPTGGFPGFTPQPPAPAPAPTSSMPGMPQPTGGFPGFGQPTPPPNPGFPPQNQPFPSPFTNPANLKKK